MSFYQNLEYVYNLNQLSQSHILWCSLISPSVSGMQIIAKSAEYIQACLLYPIIWCSRKLYSPTRRMNEWMNEWMNECLPAQQVFMFMILAVPERLDQLSNCVEEFIRLSVVKVANKRQFQFHMMEYLLIFRKCRLAVVVPATILVSIVHIAVRYVT